MTIFPMSPKTIFLYCSLECSCHPIKFAADLFPGFASVIQLFFQFLSYRKKRECLAHEIFAGFFLHVEDFVCKRHPGNRPSPVLVVHRAICSGQGSLLTVEFLSWNPDTRCLEKQ